jgi:hypothetical protein
MPVSWPAPFLDLPLAGYSIAEWHGTPVVYYGQVTQTVPTASVRRSLDFLYNLKETLTPVRLTNYAAQFG